MPPWVHDYIYEFQTKKKFLLLLCLIREFLGGFKPINKKVSEYSSELLIKDLS